MRGRVLAPVWLWARAEQGPHKMGVASLFNIPSDEDSMSFFSFNNAAHHRDIIRVIYQNDAIALEEFAIEPIVESNIQVFLQNHQVMHDQMNAVLGLSGFNLRDVNWSDPAQRQFWIGNHAFEHYQAGNILGV